MKIQRIISRFYSCRCAAIYSLAAILLMSCSIFEMEEDYSISSFDISATAGLIDNVYAAKLDTVTLAKFVSNDSLEVELNLDSLMGIESFREQVFTSLNVPASKLEPSPTKYMMLANTSFKNGYGLLDLSTSTGPGNLVFFINNYLEVTIWDINGKVIEPVEDGLPWGVVAASSLTKVRLEYMLTEGLFTVRFKRSEKLVKDEVSTFELVLLNDGTVPSKESEQICSILNSSDGSLTPINLRAFGDYDSSWTGVTFDFLYSDPARRDSLVQTLETNNALIHATDIGSNVGMTKHLELTDSYAVLDLTTRTSTKKLVFTLDEYLTVNLWEAVDSVSVSVYDTGLTFSDLGECSIIKQKSIFQLANKKYLIGFSRFAGSSMVSKYRLLITETE